MEEVRQIVRYCGISLTEAMKMPIEQRRWWISKENEDIEKKNASQNNQPVTSQNPRPLFNRQNSNQSSPPNKKKMKVSF